MTLFESCRHLLDIGLRPVLLSKTARRGKIDILDGGLRSVSNSRDQSKEGGSRTCFLSLFIALIVLLVGYPYLTDDALGAVLGGMLSLALLVTGVYAVRTHRRVFIGALLLAIIAGSASIVSLSIGIRGHPFVEGAYSVFYAFLTIAVFFDIVRTRDITADVILGSVSVYLLIGITFGTLYDLLETLEPGCFQLVGAGATEVYLGWRQLIFFSFMTLTTIGYGDITPVTYQTQSLAIIEGVIGVL